MGDSSSSTPLDFHALNSTCNNNNSPLLMNSNMELLNSISQQLENDQNFTSNIHHQHGFLSLSNDQNFSNHHHQLPIMPNFHNDHHMNISHDVYDPAAAAAAQFFTLGGPSYGCSSSIPESESMLNNNNNNIPTPPPLISGNTSKVNQYNYVHFFLFVLVVENIFFCFDISCYMYIYIVANEEDIEKLST